MAEVLWPPDLAPSAQTWNILGNAAAFVSPLTGSTRTYGRPGVRMGCTITLPPVNGQNRARMVALLAALKDRGNRVRVPDFTTGQRGSFPSSELLSNGDFGSTTGWSASGASLAATNNVLRATYAANAPSGLVITRSASTGLTQYAPYCVRGFYAGGNASLASVDARFYDGSYTISTSPAVDASGGRMVAGSGIAQSASMSAAFGNFDVSAMAGQFYELPFASFARCILVDGSPNGLLYSDQFDNAAWGKNQATVTANTQAAPDGTTTADSLVENTTSAIHSVYQSMAVSSAAQDMSASFCVKAGTRSWCVVGITDFVTHTAGIYVNLSTGATGAADSAGSNIINPRYFVRDLGNGWWRIHVVARKSGSQTSMYGYCAPATGSGGAIYSGVAAAQAIYLWRGSLAPSGSAFIPSQTTSAAASAASQTGTAIRVKGLPVSAAGLLSHGDMVEIGGQINYVTSSLDSDAAGTGIMTCGNPWRAATNDAAIHVNTPMCKMLLAPDQIDIDTGPGRFTPVTLELVEAID